MKSVALILARGGSKGILNKNIAVLKGQPLISYTINAAKHSNVDEVWVSTDSSAIKVIAKQHDVKPIDFNNGSRPRRQDRDEVYVENGAAYVTTKTALVTNRARVSGNIAVVEMPLADSFQIDTYDDMELIERFI